MRAMRWNTMPCSHQACSTYDDVSVFFSFLCWMRWRLSALFIDHERMDGPTSLVEALGRGSCACSRGSVVGSVGCHHKPSAIAIVCMLCASGMKLARTSSWQTLRRHGGLLRVWWEQRGGRRVRAWCGGGGWLSWGCMECCCRRRWWWLEREHSAAVMKAIHHDDHSLASTPSTTPPSSDTADRPLPPRHRLHHSPCSPAVLLSSSQ